MTVELDRYLSHGGSLLCAAYSGLGDAILLGPVLIELCTRYPGRVLYPGNAMLDAFRRLGVGGLAEIVPVDQRFRCPYRTPSHVWEAFVLRHRIAAIVNFRRDLLADPEGYRAGIGPIRASGIHVTDICSSTGPEWHSGEGAGQLARRYLAQLGIPVTVPAIGWLRAAIPALRAAAPARNAALLYLGSGQPHKRLPVEAWVRIASAMTAGGAEVTLLPGVDAAERDDAQRLSTLLRVRGVATACLPPTEVAEGPALLVRYGVVVACDTYMVHLAGAMGVPAVGIYFSTDSTIYGPHDGGFGVESPGYAKCPRRTRLGNCDAWEHGCDARPCLSELDLDRVVWCARSCLDNAPRPSAAAPMVGT